MMARIKYLQPYFYTGLKIKKNSIRENITLKISLIIGGTGTRTAVEIVTVNRDLKIKIGQIAGVAEVQNILTKRNKKTMKAEVSVVKIKNCKFFDRELDI